jgi:DNA-directed RNA polymerase specialized sigma24 family protein
MENLTLTPKERINHELPKLLFTIKEAAYILSVSEKSIRRFLERGLLKSSHALRTKLITRESIEGFAKLTT